jgi:hypothetical protein
MFILISIGLIILVNLPFVILYLKKKNQPVSTKDDKSKSILNIYIKTETEQAFIYTYNTKLQNWSFAIIVFIIAFFRGFVWSIATFAWLMFFSILAACSKESQEIKKAMKNGNVTVSGNKFPIKNPLTVIINKDQPFIN